MPLGVGVACRGARGLQQRRGQQPVIGGPRLSWSLRQAPKPGHVGRPLRRFFACVATLWIHRVKRLMRQHHFVRAGKSALLYSSTLPDRCQWGSAVPSLGYLVEAARQQEHIMS